jgi:hypothetical protein
VVGGAGERPAKSSLTSPVFVLLDCPYCGEPPPPPCLQTLKSAQSPRCAGDCPRALAVSASTVRRGQDRLERVYGKCKAVTGHAAIGRIVGLDAVRVNDVSWP